MHCYEDMFEMTCKTKKIRFFTKIQLKVLKLLSAVVNTFIYLLKSR